MQHYFISFIGTSPMMVLKEKENLELSISLVHSFNLCSPRLVFSSAYADTCYNMKLGQTCAGFILFAWALLW
jgi:hypothetical protein